MIDCKKVAETKTNSGSVGTSLTAFCELRWSRHQILLRLWWYKLHCLLLRLPLWHLLPLNLPSVTHSTGADALQISLSSKIFSFDPYAGGLHNLEKVTLDKKERDQGCSPQNFVASSFQFSSLLLLFCLLKHCSDNKGNSLIFEVLIISLLSELKISSYEQI